MSVLHLLATHWFRVSPANKQIRFVFSTNTCYSSILMQQAKNNNYQESSCFLGPVSVQKSSLWILTTCTERFSFMVKMSNIVSRLQVSLPFLTFILRRDVSFTVSFISSNHVYQWKLQLTLKMLHRYTHKGREGGSKLWLPATHKPPLILTCTIFFQCYLYPSLTRAFFISNFSFIYMLNPTILWTPY